MVLRSDSDSDWLAAWQATECEPVFVADDSHVWRKLAAAWQRGKVEFRYWGGSEPGAGRRVTPEAVLTVAGSPTIYAEAFCHGRGERGDLRLDRVEWPAD